MRLARPWLALLLPVALAAFIGCPPPTGELDDDDVAEDDDDFSDDDDNVDDDDSTVVDDDDFTIPPGTGLGGTILYQSASGQLPAGAVRAGLAHMGPEGLPDDERWSDQVAADGLIGDTVYTVYVEGDPPDGDFFDILGGIAEASIYYPFTYVDVDGGGDYSAADHILGFSDLIHAFIRFDGEDVPDALEAWGGGGGWNTLEVDDLADDDDELDLSHTPEGTNSAIGPEIRITLLANSGGAVPLTTDVLMPTGSVVSAIHYSVFDEDVPNVSAPERFTTAASNYELRAEDLIDWNIAGSPATSHIGPWDPDADVTVDVALYYVVGYFDDGDQSFTWGTCDTLLTAGATRFLLWVEPSTLDLTSGFWAWLVDVPMGWTLYDTQLETWRLLISGIELASIGDVWGDDDDSAASDDDDSADGPDLGIPEECLPGDDDDSAASDDDDSAGGS